MSTMKQKLKNKIDYKVWSIGIMALVLLMAFVGYRQMEAYESSVLSIYADQQDAFVQLVLDQINLQPDRTDEDIIRDILGSLDTSNRKYWTLSKNQSLLFVKDITETNRYKGFTNATYYVSESAARFMENLEVNRVRHEIIEIDGKRYVISGVIFAYRGEDYKICLLTNETFILDQNVFLSSKIALYIFIAVILLGFLLVTLILNRFLDRKTRKIQALSEKTQLLNRQVEQMEEKIESMDDYHTRWNLFHGSLMDAFVTKLSQRELDSVVFLQLSFGDREQRNVFLEKAQLLLDEKVLRFSVKKHDIVLVFLQYREEDVQKAMERMQMEESVVGSPVACGRPEQSLRECYEDFLRRAGLAEKIGEEDTDE